MVKANKMKSKVRRVLMERLQLNGDLLHEAPDTPATKAIMMEIILIANELELDIGQQDYVGVLSGEQTTPVPEEVKAFVDGMAKAMEEVVAGQVKKAE